MKRAVLIAVVAITAFQAASLGASATGSVAASVAGHTHSPRVGVAIVRNLGCGHNYRVATIVVDLHEGGRSRRLFGPFASSCDPVVDLSHDGRWLVYSDPKVRPHLVNLKTHGQRVIRTPSTFLFSPDNRYLAFLTNREWGRGWGYIGRLKVLDLGTGTWVSLGSQAAMATKPQWSHAGNRLVWVNSTGGWDEVSLVHPLHVKRIHVSGSTSPPSWSWSDNAFFYYRLKGEHGQSVFWDLMKWSLATRHASKVTQVETGSTYSSSAAPVVFHDRVLCTFLCGPQRHACTVSRAATVSRGGPIHRSYLVITHGTTTTNIGLPCGTMVDSFPESYQDSDSLQGVGRVLLRLQGIQGADPIVTWHPGQGVIHRVGHGIFMFWIAPAGGR